MVSNNDDDGELSGSDADEGFDEDMESLRRACILTGTDLNSLQPSSATSTADDTTAGTAVSGGGGASDSEADLELVREIQQRFSACTQAEMPLFLKPLNTLPPSVSDDDEDDFETLRAIKRRFAGYDKDSLKSSTDNYMNKLEQVHATNTALEKTSNNLVGQRTNVTDRFPDSSDVPNTSQNSESNIPRIGSSALIEWHQPETPNLSLIPVGVSGFPKSAQMFVDAIKKNRACQKFIRSKLIQIEARIEENKKLKQRVKTLKDFQISCKKRTGRALSQKKDARVQLISAVKPRANSKGDGKKFSPLYYGPNENSHVASYRMLLTRFPISLNRKNWSDEERENLAKGIKQQFQEMLLQKSVDLISDVEGYGDSNGFDSVIASIRDLDITPENMRSFLPKVNWNRLASMYVTGRSGAECEARWLNCEDPLINRHPWTKLEDKKLLHIVQQRGINDWIDIASLLETNRTPFQCLARYQRSLNASIMKREWTEDEDDKLRSAVEVLGEGNWQLVASTLDGRTGTQCSNRWMKSLHPVRQRVGRWTSDEDKRLKVAVMFFGPKTWKKIAQFVPGRTHVQCRERWSNSLDPSLNLGEWTEEEDSLLKAAIMEHGYCWSKVAACVRPRTDNQCWRRWKDLCPHEVPLLQAARQIQKAALISNFVDRESERPALGPNDFVSLALTNAISESENLNPPGKQKRKSRSKRPTKEAQICSEVPLLTNGNEVENCGGSDSISKKRVKKARAKKRSSKPTQDVTRNVRVWPSTGWTKRKRSLGRRKRKFQGGPDAASRDNAISIKPYSNKNESTDPMNAQLLACADSEFLTMNVIEEDIRELCGDHAAKTGNATEPGQRNSECVEPLDEISGMIKAIELVSSGENDATSEKNKDLSLLHLNQDKHIDLARVDSSFYPISASSKIASVNEVEAYGGDDAVKKNSQKLSSNNKYSQLMEELPERTNPSEGETFGGDGALLKKKKRVMKRGLNKRADLNHSSSSKSLTITENEIEVFNGNAATNKRKASKPCSNKCTEPLKNSKDITTLHWKKRPVICQQERLNRSPTREESCSNHILEAEDGDDMTLACFINNRLKKRRLKLAEKGNDASCFITSMKGSKSIFEENDCNGGRSDVFSSPALHLKDISEDPLGILAGVTQSPSEDPLGILAGDLNIWKSDSVVGEGSFHESLKESMGTDLEGFYKTCDDP